MKINVLRTTTRRRRLILGLIVMLILILVGSGVGTFYVLSQRSPAHFPANQVGGHAFFKSSGQLNEGNSEGINDQLQMDLYGIPNPAPDKSYYAWLLGDKYKNTAENVCRPAEELIFLGVVLVNQGTVHFTYRGDKQHTNLISCTSRLLITEENPTVTPHQPSADTHNWRYYAEIPQQPDPQDSVNDYSILDDLRHLLSEGPDLKRQGIHGGLDLQLLRNTQKILEWAGSARDDWAGKNTSDINFIHRQVVRILDYLDGTYKPKGVTVPLVQTDVPPGTPLLVDPKFAQVPLLDLPRRNTSYMARISHQLANIVATPGVLPEKRLLAQQTNTELLKVKVWLANVYKDAKALVILNDAQLRQPSTLTILDDLQIQANTVLVGQLDPSTGQVAAGVIQLHYNIQELATLDVKPYSTSS